MIGGLYCICDTSLTPGRTHESLARQLLAGGARTIQLRDKTGLQQEAAQEIMALKGTRDFTFIINDYPELAVEAGADGLHIGADDIPIGEARRILGKQKIIGYSAHSLEEAIRAEAEGADYAAFGAIFPTATKGPGHPVQGLKKLEAVVRALRIPVIAIGGINRTNVRQVLETGAGGFAMISGLVLSPDIAAEVQWYEKFFSSSS